MKNFKLIGLVLLIATGFFITQCTTDSIEGPMGPPGADGTDGKDGTASCVACHQDSHRNPIKAAYSISKHGDPTVMFNGQILPQYANSFAEFGLDCNKCHTSEGYKDFLREGRPLTFTSPTYNLPQAFDCKTCHGEHKTFNFEVDGLDFALRSVLPVTLMVDQSYTIDYGNNSNNCAQCHQPRSPAPTDDGTGDFSITSEFWGPHHGPQSTLLEGIQGSEIAGSTPYPSPKSAAHRTGSSCNQCHMGEPSNSENGSHSFWPTDNACKQCHGDSGPPSSVDGLQADMEVLKTLLVDIGIINESDYPVPGTYPFKEAQAAWNYILILEDRSNGTHNPNYAKALVKNSIETLD